MIGLLPAAAYTQYLFQMLPGDILFAFSDGISEAMNASDDEWGEDQMIAEAKVHADVQVAELLKRMFRAADAFADGAPQHDDMTILLMKLAP